MLSFQWPRQGTLAGSFLTYGGGLLLSLDRAVVVAISDPRLGFPIGPTRFVTLDGSRFHAGGIGLRKAWQRREH